MAEIWLVSDTHFGHAKCLTFQVPDRHYVCRLEPCDDQCRRTTHPELPMRAFSSVEEMDEHMVERWNAVVRPQDKVYHLGDVVMRKEHLAIMGRLKGHKRLVRGNHDIHDTRLYLPYFDDIYGSRKLDDLILTHIPIHPGSLRWAGNVHGHVHNNVWSVGERYLNVSVEVINYTPIPLYEAKRRLREGWPT